MIVKIENFDGEDVLIFPEELREKWDIKEDDKDKIHYENGSLIFTKIIDVSKQID